MALTEQDLVSILREKALERWSIDEQPYLLSLFAPSLREKGEDYRTVLNDEKLKSFARRTGKVGGYTLVEHPTQKPKVGIIPAGMKFEFEHHSQAAPEHTGEHERVSLSERERIIIEFLRALSHLPDSLLEDVVIPSKVLARLLAKR